MPNLGIIVPDMGMNDSLRPGKVSEAAARYAAASLSGALFTEPEIHHTTFDEAPRINLGGMHADERLLSPRSEERVQLLRSELEPHAHGGAELYTINCDVEVLHVISGEVTVRFADRSVVLAAGDALTFPGRQPHTWEVTGGGAASVAWVIVPAPWSGSA